LGLEMTDHVDIAVRLLAAAGAADFDTVRAIYAPDAQIWRNTDPVDYPGLTVEEHIGFLQWARAGLSDLRYRVRRTVATQDGFAQTFVVEAHTKGGQSVVVPVMAIGFMRAGRVVRKEEYMNMAEVDAIIAAVAQANPMDAPSAPGAASLN
jgi:uncharacterized protein